MELARRPLSFAVVFTLVWSLLVRVISFDPRLDFWLSFEPLRLVSPEVRQSFAELSLEPRLCFPFDPTIVLVEFCLGFRALGSLEFRRGLSVDLAMVVFSECLAAAA